MTLSFAAACVLAGAPPWELEAWVLARVYDWMAVQRALDRHPDPIEREEVREEAREAITRHWAEDEKTRRFIKEHGSYFTYSRPNILEILKAILMEYLPITPKDIIGKRFGPIKVNVPLHYIELCLQKLLPLEIL